MPTFPIDSTRAVLVATGKVAPVTEWVDGRSTDTPRRDPSTGFPLWLVDCLVDDDDAARAAIAGVEVPSLDEPRVAKFRPVAFEGLVVDAYVNRKTSALVTRWSAESIADGAVVAVAS